MCVSGGLCVSRLHRENECLREELSSTRELVQRLEEDRQRDHATMQDLRTHTQTLQRGCVDPLTSHHSISVGYAGAVWLFRHLDMDMSCSCVYVRVALCRLSQGGGSPQRALASREEAEALLMVIVFGYISGVFRR